MTPKIKANIGAALKAARKAKGITSKEMAALIGVNQHSYILEVEKGIFSTADTPRRFFKALGSRYYDCYSWRVEEPKKANNKK